MNKIRIILDYIDGNEVVDHLNQLNGIQNIEVDYVKDELVIEYNNEINIKVIFEEILKYTTAIRNFERILNDEFVEYKFVVDDLCCEHCYMSALFDLIKYDAIVSVDSDFGYNEKDGFESFLNVNIIVKVIKNRITKDLEDKIKKAFE